MKSSLLFRVLALLVFVALAALAALSGVASLYVTAAGKSNNPTSAETALKLSGGDPEAHLMRGELFELENDLPRAIAEYQRSVDLRPADYVLWLILARAKELNGENDAALTAARNAVLLAPFYAQPHWQLGNMLVRRGQRDEGLSELARAGQSNPNLAPAIIDLVWQVSDGNVQFVVNTLKPERPESYLALAQYFRKHEQIEAALMMYKGAGASSDAEKARQAYVAELVQTKHFKEAYALWTNQPSLTEPQIGPMIDPGFEQESNLEGAGFGWRSVSRPGLLLALDQDRPHGGSSSLRIQFKGDADPAIPAISQLVLIYPASRYRLRFAGRAEEIVSGGLPIVKVVDANSGESLGQVTDLSQPASAWREFQIDFITHPTTNAIELSLSRNNCSTSPCPIYGRLWLDDFSLEKQ